jgi:hypothetical protein
VTALQTQQRQPPRRRRVAISKEIADMMDAVTITVRKVDDLAARAEALWAERHATLLFAKHKRRLMVKCALTRLTHMTGTKPLALKIGGEFAFRLLTWRTLEHIAATYPDLGDEAERLAWERFPDGPPRLDDVIVL